MKSHHKNAVQAAGGSIILLTLLTACPRPIPPPITSTTLNFRFPDMAQTGGLTLAAIYFLDGSDPQQKAGVQVLTTGGLGKDGQFSYPGGPNSGGMVNGGTLRLDSYLLDPLKKNVACLTPFKTGEAKGLNNVVVTPEAAKTCNVYFTLFRDANGNGRPESGEELFNTHDIYSYADSAFNYSFSSTDGKSQEKGTRVAGWSLVRHEVLQPTATPGQYRVTMNSVPAADEALTIRLHEPTNRLISMGLNGLGGLK
ncbi:hypothetical protein [Deinococcus sp. AJ005]|uniref:hypothetical protein n=1 Tax=Deinococcus sp. AJ005 TaxID=2652443 RepID=UPI00125CB19C|nr:hypothetical protein [Deinococcus sp. AJ005]QFP77937.1 hypothetical protein DAAJ005_16905 [Deinococcus sp. AJ005]